MIEIQQLNNDHPFSFTARYEYNQLSNCHNFSSLHPIVKTVTPLESLQFSRFNNVYHYQSKVSSMPHQEVHHVQLKFTGLKWLHSAYNINSGLSFLLSFHNRGSTVHT